MARDPARIPVILDLINEAWLATGTDQRLGQLLLNVLGTNYERLDLYNVEDDVVIDELKEWIETSRNWSGR